MFILREMEEHFKKKVMWGEKNLYQQGYSSTNMALF